jgi:hypothetical protein
MISNFVPVRIGTAKIDPLVPVGPSALPTTVP